MENKLNMIQQRTFASRGVIKENIPFSEVVTGRPKGNSHKLREGELQVDIRDKFLSGRRVHWNRLPKRLWSLYPWRHAKLSWTWP